MYSSYAFLYDQFYQRKDYRKEVEFLEKVFHENQIQTILDVGCGTGNHMHRLEKKGFYLKEEFIKWICLPLSF